ncbi:Glycerophosphodiester phosphodiesterase, cytoplasmic [Vibrio stylophorae]|uniref:Glycerophosphodiester phosphodiesterase, cytoplasmic n=1 Tax=Vibrio stylophorae TaxID=659351 RepID=A0ABM8ZWV7_9VIBR|nr:glycerophosphodiester phosphodiesterase family protein [Vibrio stylophorae]CAH0535129.1 Glycerophosphodiester phosphodiesterase, cytoplasmic [Vibrio stylophorae]
MRWDLSSPLIFGHRGAAANAPENTAISIKTAALQGATWIEVDLQPAADGTLMVCHDYQLARYIGQRLWLRQQSVQALKQLDMGHWFAPRFQGEPMLTLSELLQLVEQLNLSVNIELKVRQRNPTHIVDTLMTALQASQLSANQVLISSFDNRTMRALKSYLAQQPLGYGLGVLANALSLSKRALIDEISPDSCHLWAKLIDQKNVDWLKARQIPVFCYTVNDTAQAAQLWEMGVQGFFTDSPQRLLNWQKRIDN